MRRLAIYLSIVRGAAWRAGILQHVELLDGPVPLVRYCRIPWRAVGVKIVFSVGDALIQVVSLVGRIKEQLILLDRSADRAAELIQIQLRPGNPVLLLNQSLAGQETLRLYQ